LGFVFELLQTHTKRKENGVKYRVAAQLRKAFPASSLTVLQVTNLIVAVAKIDRS